MRLQRITREACLWPCVRRCQSSTLVRR